MARSRPAPISPARRTAAWAGRNISCGQGYAVYVIDQPGRGRASYDADSEGPQAFPDLAGTEQRFTAPERSKLWPQARLHTQWPGSGVAGDPVFDQFYASQVPFVRTPEKAQEMTRDALVALLEKSARRS